MRLSFEDEESFKEAAESLRFNKPPSDLNTVENSSSLPPQERREDICFNNPSDDPNTLGVMRSSTNTTPGEEWGYLKISIYLQIIQLTKGSIIVYNLHGGIKSDCPHLSPRQKIYDGVAVFRIAPKCGWRANDIHLKSQLNRSREHPDRVFVKGVDSIIWANWSATVRLLVRSNTVFFFLSPCIRVVACMIFFGVL